VRREPRPAALPRAKSRLRRLRGARPLRRVYQLSYTSKSGLLAHPQQRLF